ncbi:response regulator [Bradyrhizobium sp. STM 3557]|uniref:response regulator n=1 Tax=Bradyrhizobium sp. STM 3557 TaxID=578920 RepID=UPI00389062E9
MSAVSLDALDVLVIEDDYYIADDMRQWLENAGAHVLGPCPDVETAFRTLEQYHADCAVVDINLGNGPSFDPARDLLARGMSVVLVTGYDAKVIPTDLSHLPCLHKPTEPQKIIKAVHDVCSTGGR